MNSIERREFDEAISPADDAIQNVSRRETLKIQACCIIKSGKETADNTRV